jgi:hypothetical protein
MYCRVPKIVAVSLLIVSANSAIAQEGSLPQPTPPLTSSNRSDAWKIENALSAGPKFITDHATVMIWASAQDKELKMRVLREGSNGWVCMPEGDGLVDHGDLLVFDHEKPRHIPMCADQTMMKWMMAIRAGKKPNVDRIGISYMLQGEGAVGAHVRFAGPHVMLVLPDGEKDALKDVGRYTPSGEPYVVGPGSPSPLLIIPVAKPDEDIFMRTTAASK